MIADEKLINERLRICDQCGSKIVQNGMDKCKECGCVLAGKASIKQPTCPLKKWVTN